MEKNFLLELDEVIKDRQLNPSPASYTTALFEGGSNKMIKKLGEENAEFIKAFLTESPEEVKGEAADYIYHLMVALRFRGISMADIIAELEKRHGSK